MVRGSNPRRGAKPHFPCFTLPAGTRDLTRRWYNRKVVSVQIAAPNFDPMFAALADHTRRDIVRRAISAEEGVLELSSRYPMSFAAVQKHVAVLERAGLITKQRVGRRRVVRDQPRGAARRAPPARPVRGAVAGKDRPHARAPRRAGGRHRHRGDKGEQTMTVTSVRKDPQRLTLTVEAELDASVERIRQLWADPR